MYTFKYFSVKLLNSARLYFSPIYFKGMRIIANENCIIMLKKALVKVLQWNLYLYMYVCIQISIITAELRNLDPISID